MSSARGSSARPPRQPLMSTHLNYQDHHQRSDRSSKSVSSSVTYQSLATRHTRDQSVSAEEASQAIRSFIIPMFESIKQVASSSFKNSNKKKLLSSKLKKLIRFSKQEITRKHKEINAIKENLGSYKDQVNHLKEKINHAQNWLNLQTSYKHCKENSSEFDTNECFNSLNSRETLQKELSEEISINENILNATVKNFHINSTLKMQNGIMGELLIGLNSSQTAVPVSKDINEMAHELNSLEKGTIDCFLIQSFLNSSQFQKSYDASQEKTNSMQEILQVKTALNTKAHALRKEIASTSLQNKKVREHFEKTQQKYSLLQMQYDKLSMTCNNILKKESVCKNCNDIYQEENNYNWSCSRHLSPWTGIYFCCGSINKEAKGCVSSKHCSKDIKIRSLSKQAVCSSCRGRGHSYNQCPKDPNPPSLDDLQHSYSFSQKRNLRLLERLLNRDMAQSKARTMARTIAKKKNENLEESTNIRPDRMPFSKMDREDSKILAD